MIGHGPMQKRLASDLPDGVEMLGRVSRVELYERLARAHCLVVPSVREGWGLVVIEANSVGTPAVGYDVPGIRDSIRHQQTGLLAPSGDDKALAEQALELLQNRSKYEEIGARAMEWSRVFSWDTTAARLMDVIRMSQGHVALELKDEAMKQVDSPQVEIPDPVRSGAISAPTF
jgi:glycosyltransferase involved in cell wall biosynthesis